MTKGHRGGRHNLYRKAKESFLSAFSHAYRHRRERKGDMRRLWNIRINAAARLHGTSYSQFIASLKENEIEINRKSLAYLAVNEPDSFAELVKLTLK